MNAYTFQLQRPATRRQSHAKAIFAKARISPHEKETIRGGAADVAAAEKVKRQPMGPSRLWICHSAEANGLIPCMTMG